MGLASRVGVRKCEMIFMETFRLSPSSQVPVLPFKEHVFGMAVCLPHGSLRNSQRLLGSGRVMQRHSVAKFRYNFGTFEKWELPAVSGVSDTIEACSYRAVAPMNFENIKFRIFLVIGWSYSAYCQIRAQENSSLKQSRLTSPHSGVYPELQPEDLLARNQEI